MEQEVNLVEEGEGAEEEGPEVDPLVEAPEPLQKPYGSTPNPTGRANPSQWKKAQRLTAGGAESRAAALAYFESTF